MSLNKYSEDIKRILLSNISEEDKKNQILQYHHNDIAQVLDELDDESRDELFKLLGN